jgi:hypothetical protein
VTQTQPGVGLVEGPAEQVANELLQVFGLAGVSQPDPQNGGTYHLIDWGDLWDNLRQDAHQVAELPGKARDLVEEAWDIEVQQAQDYFDIATGLVEDVFSIGDSFWDIAKNGVLSSILDFVGIETTTQVQTAVSGVLSTVTRLGNKVQVLKQGLSDLWDLVGRIDARLKQLEYLMGAFVLPAIEALPSIIPDVETEVERQLQPLQGFVWSLWTEVLNLTEVNLTEVTQTIQTLVEVEVQNAVTNIFTETLTEVDPIAIPAIATLTQVITEVDERAQACCAEANDAAKRAQKCCDDNKGKIPDLSGLLGIYTAAEVTAAITALVADHGDEFAGLVSGWINGDIDPTDLLTAGVGTIGDVIGL